MLSQYSINIKSIINDIIYILFNVMATLNPGGILYVEEFIIQIGYVTSPGKPLRTGGHHVRYCSPRL